jgi:hypothetical protein
MLLTVSLFHGLSFPSPVQCLSRLFFINTVPTTNCATSKRPVPPRCGILFRHVRWNCVAGCNSAKDNNFWLHMFSASVSHAGCTFCVLWCFKLAVRCHFHCLAKVRCGSQRKKLLLQYVTVSSYWHFYRNLVHFPRIYCCFCFFRNAYGSELELLWSWLIWSLLCLAEFSV